MPARAGANDRRSGDNCDPSASPMCASQFFGDFANDGRFGFLGVNDVVDELERIGVRGGSLHWHHPDSLVSDNNLVPFFYVEEFNGSRTAFFPVNNDCAIDNSGRHLYLLIVETNKRLLVRCNVKL